jgi:hypothetical protein
MTLGDEIQSLPSLDKNIKSLHFMINFGPQCFPTGTQTVLIFTVLDLKTRDMTGRGQKTRSLLDKHFGPHIFTLGENVLSCPGIAIQNVIEGNILRLQIFFVRLHRRLDKFWNV